jgi:glucose-6-phosphate dehydrogenase assembly protein OpcA
LTLVALVSEPSLLERAQKVVAEVVRAHPSRTIVAVWKGGEKPAITADVALHRAAASAPACGDAITLEAVGDGREWLPENVDRLALPDLPRCVWWVGDLPDFDRLFDRFVVDADLVVVNSGEMDLRDLEKLSTIALRLREGCALSDLTWIRLRPLQELVARFFDDERVLGCLPALERVTIEFAPREVELDVASTQAGLLFGWIANALSLRSEAVQWKQEEGWGEARLGRIVARFERRLRRDVPAGTILRVAFEGDGARFEIERQEDPQVFRWSREVPGVPTPPQTLRIGIHEEAKLLTRCLERPQRDPLLENSLHMASRIVRPVAPRLSKRP